jgi:two-component system response regulator GlrR
MTSNLSLEAMQTLAKTAVIPPRPETWSHDLKVPRLTLEVLEGPDQGVKVVPEQVCFSLGTHASNDIVLTDPTVSRFHCELATTEQGILVRDVGSSNGCEVDAVRVREAWLRHGSRIRLGSTLIAVHVSADVTSVPVSERTSMGQLVGGSTLMRSVFTLLERCAESDSSVLLEGESGTGKEEAAYTIHEHSARAKKKFVVVDCGSIPPTLFESELFGHERGAFTGAGQARPGAFEVAHGGTVFLDEIGEVPLDLQPKLLRVLEDLTVQRVGSQRRRRVDVRVIAATNRDLRAEVNAGRFRSDLFYRLAVLRVRLPALRERTEDLPMLVRALLTRLEATEDQQRRFGARSFLDWLRYATWPGNVRELRNHLERCLALDAPFPTSASNVASAAAPTPPGTLPDYAEARKRAIENFEHEYLQALVDRHHENLSRGARECGIDRGHLHRLLARHKITPQTRDEG